MNRIEHTLQLIEEDARLFENSVKIARTTIQCFEENPATTPLGFICQLAASFAVGGVVGFSLAVARDDVRALVTGAPLRKPYEKEPQMLLDYFKPEPTSYLPITSGAAREFVRKRRVVSRKTSKPVAARKYRRLGSSEVEKCPPHFLFPI
jgi:hypothetical protein